MDPNAAVLTPRGERVVLVDNSDARCGHLIDAVLEAFSDMGASEEMLQGERCRLQHDACYFFEWVVCLADWNTNGVLIQRQPSEDVL